MNDFSIDNIAHIITEDPDVIDENFRQLLAAGLAGLGGLGMAGSAEAQDTTSAKPATTSQDESVRVYNLSAINRILAEYGLHKTRNEVRFDPKFVTNIQDKVGAGDVQGALNDTLRLLNHHETTFDRNPNLKDRTVLEYVKIYTLLYNALYESLNGKPPKNGMRNYEVYEKRFERR